MDLGTVKVAASSVSGLAPVATSGNASDINGLGSLATKNTVSATGGDITGLGSLATKNKVSATTEVTGLASVATGGNLDYSKVSGLGALATEDSINYSDLTGKPDLSVYATNSALSNYVLATTLSQTLTSYTTNSALATTLSDYLTITSAENTYIKPAALAGYIQTNVGIGTPDAGTSYFMVSNQGLLTAENAIIKGTVFAGSGAIGGITIGNNGISSTNGNFSVNSSGHIYANDITLANGSVGSTGTFTFGTDANRNSYLKSGMTSLNDTTHNGIYVGTDGIALGKGVFKVLANGSITATTLTVGAGQISGTLAEGNIPSLSQSKITGLTNDLADIEDIAEGAASDASSAVTTANSAASTASSAASTASTAATNASTALTKANTAISDAASAVTTANTASTNASNAVTTANSAASTASAAATAAANAATAVTNSRDAIAYHFGYADYDTMVAAARAGGATFVQGGYLNTNLIQSDAVVTNYLSAHKITANQIDTAGLTISSGQVTGLGSLATKSSVGSTDLDSTIISGGYIKTSLIDADAIVTNYLSSNYITADQIDGNRLVVTNGIFSGEVTASRLNLALGVSISQDHISNLTSDLASKANSSDLSNVAFSGDYDDLTNTPTIPSLQGYIYQDGVVGTTPAAGATGFVVSSSGLLTASNAIIYGTIYASAGQIGN